MKIQYLCLVIFLSLIKNTLGNASFQIQGHLRENGEELKNRQSVNPGDKILVQYICDAATEGTFNTMVYCDSCSSLKNASKIGDVGEYNEKFRVDCNNPLPIELRIPDEAQRDGIVFFAYYIDFVKEGSVSESSPYFFIQNENPPTDRTISSSKKSNVMQRYSENFQTQKDKKVAWEDKAKNVFLFVVPVLVGIALLFVVYQKSFKPKQELHAKKSVCKYNFEKNPNTLKSLDSQGLRMTGRNVESGMQKRNSLTNLKTLQSKLKSPITESVNYESSKPITSRRGSTSSSCSSNLSFRLDASYLDVKLKDEDSDIEENNIESDDEEKLMDNNHVAVNIDDNRRGREDQRGRGMPPDGRNKSRTRNDYRERNMSGDNNPPPPPPQRRSGDSVRRNNVSRERRNDSRSPMNSPNAPVAPSRLDSKSPMNSPSSPNTPNSYSSNNSMNNRPNMNNSSLVARNLNNPNMNNQVSIDIHSPRSANPHNNNVKLSNNLQDTLSTDKNAVIHNASKGYVTANSPSQVASAQRTHVQYANAPQQPKQQQSKSNFQNDTASGSEDTAEVVPNHPFNDKVFSVAYINVPENDDELELVIGDQIKFMEVYDDDWALALRIRDRKEGMVPLTCVKEYYTILHKN